MAYYIILPKNIIRNNVVFWMEPVVASCSIYLMAFLLIILATFRNARTWITKTLSMIFTIIQGLSSPQLCIFRYFFEDFVMFLFICL